MPAEISQMLVSILPIVGLFAVLWFFMLRPEMKRNKETKKMRENVKPGDNICTIGGIYGKVVSIDEKVLRVEIGLGQDKHTIAVARWAVGNVENSGLQDETIS